MENNSKGLIWFYGNHKQLYNHLLCVFRRIWFLCDWGKKRNNEKYEKDDWVKQFIFGKDQLDGFSLCITFSFYITNFWYIFIRAEMDRGGEIYHSAKSGDTSPAPETKPRKVRGKSLACTLQKLKPSSKCQAPNFSTTHK